MAWNGSDLADEFAELLNDSSASFTTKVLGWINDVILDISTKHNWAFYRAYGKKSLTANTDKQSLVIAAPSAPTLAALAGGSLLTGKSYSVAVTFYDSVEKIETKLGTSASITPAAADLSITLTNIPVALESTIDSRRIYLKNVTDGGEWLLYSTISNNTATTSTITAIAATTSDNPPEYDYFKILDGDIRFETTKRNLKLLPLQQLMQICSGQVIAGTPTYYAELGNARFVFSPYPSAAIVASFYFFRRPRKVYSDTTNEPDIPREFKELLKLGVLWKGHEFRERADKEIKKQIYDQALSAAISNLGDYVTGPIITRDVMGNSNGQVEV